MNLRGAIFFITTWALSGSRNTEATMSKESGVAECDGGFPVDG